MHKYTGPERAFIKQYAAGHSYKEITEAVNKKFNISLTGNQIRSFLGNNGISTGRNGRFEKGSIPANKGKRMEAETYKKCYPTMFKKGNTPINHKPVGTVSIRNNYNKGEKYVYEKVAEPNVWRMKHILEWEKHYGPVPKDKIIIFADGNPLNTDINNLLMISRSQNAVMNRWKIRGCDKETMEVASNVASLKIQMSIRKKERNKKNALKENFA